LAELDPPPLQALLLEGTPEHELAAEGPVLVRMGWEHASQLDWLARFCRETQTQYRTLLLLSHWPFEALAEHLRYFTQAQWKQGAGCGILRYYDTRLFKCIIELFVGEVSRHFHAPAISWHWIDRDQREQQIAGMPRPFDDCTPCRTPLMLEQYQVDAICLRTAAEQWESLHGLPERNYAVGKEQRVNQIQLGLFEADSKHLKGEEHTAFMVQWLAQRFPETLPKQEGPF
jgi:hypothetical protein